MATTLERSVEEEVDDMQGSSLVDETCGKRDDVGVIMLSGERCNLFVPAESTADVRVFIDSHLDAVAGAANDDTSRKLPFVDSGAHLMGEVGIIDTIRRKGTEVLNIKIFRMEKFYYFVFQFISGVVGSYRYYFFHRENFLQNYNKKAVFMLMNYNKAFKK